ncbi:radical SAM protein [uncultured Agrobacterium sp.]|uniref:B12-binding domain-containing radical SAM protein n=1 Tax=uncultured Agrobacterium sp. TaxID=157277 RepID=UPI0025E75287|nr:radical SAM protein [uncultured Agrobacterium sp.]
MRDAQVARQRDFTGTVFDKVALVQLPFPSQADPAPEIVSYYENYSKLYRTVFPSYFIPDGELWEAPLWVAHLDGAIGRSDTTFHDLSRLPADAKNLSVSLLDSITGATGVFLSPLAQNFDLARDVSKLLLAEGVTTVIGGNMADLAEPADFTTIFRGLARGGMLDEIRQSAGFAGTKPVLGRQLSPISYRPDYRYLKPFADKVPLIRLNSSHGCLFGCTFCGDAWSKQLHLVARDDLRSEFQDIKSTFPNLRTIYVGDKTFGQSKEAVSNLLDVACGAGYDFIVQTHIELISDDLIDQMVELGVKVVEMGFETADSDLLRKMKKVSRSDRYLQAFEKMNSHGLKVILNVLGGLPHSTQDSHKKTMDFLWKTQDFIFLYNIYNFVPYPKTPIFPLIKNRIRDWNFAHWREDMPVVFEPFNQSAEDSWVQFREIVALCTAITGRKVAAGETASEN